MNPARVAVAEAITSPSTPAASTASTSAQPCARQYRPVTDSIASGTTSVTNTRSTASDEANVSTWNAPIRPRPTTPIRTHTMPFHHAAIVTTMGPRPNHEHDRKPPPIPDSGTQPG